MVLIIICYILGIAMIYLGFSQQKSEGFTFGAILLICAAMWHYKRLIEKRNNNRK